MSLRGLGKQMRWDCLGHNLNSKRYHFFGAKAAMGRGCSWVPCPLHSRGSGSWWVASGLEGMGTVLYPTKRRRLLFTEKGSTTEAHPILLCRIQVCILSEAVLYWEPPVRAESCMGCKGKNSNWQKPGKGKVICAIKITFKRSHS